MRSRCMSVPRAAPASRRPKSTIKEVEDFVRKTIEKEDLELILSEIGVTSDWSAAYTLNAGPMDAVVKIQLTEERTKSAQEYVHMLRTACARILDSASSATWNSPSTPAAWSARP